MSAVTIPPSGTVNMSREKSDGTNRRTPAAFAAASSRVWPPMISSGPPWIAETTV